ncbi:hypothetical protein [Desulfovibrio inopinatus]|uniref:hypothetical protein n=1 Tax=Desulfovibrio inopinatus TaxID=102109 RepID=UPI0003FD8954|nr:hypothetical protein [Desulfovibrio inopinatus]
MRKLLISTLVFVFCILSLHSVYAANDDDDIFVLIVGAVTAQQTVPYVVVKDIENNWLETTATSVVLSGYYSGSTSLTWRNTTNNTSGSVVGTYEFSTASIQLALGDNTIQFLNGSKVLTTITVTRSPTGVDINSLPTFNPGQIETDTSTTVYCTLGVDIQPGRTYTVILYNSDADGHLGTQAATMLDDGDFQGASGDDILNDGVFTAKLVLSPTEEGFQYYRAAVTTDLNDTAQSSLGLLEVYAAPSQEHITQAETVSTDINSFWNNIAPVSSMYRSKSAYLRAVNDAQDSLVSHISSMSNAIFATKGENAVVFAFKDVPFLMMQKTIFDLSQWESSLDDGVPAVPEGAVVVGPPVDATTTSLDRSGGVPQVVAGAKYPTFLPSGKRTTRATADENIIKNKSALFLDPYYWQHVHSTKMNDANGPWPVITGSEKPKLTSTTVLNGSDASANVDPKRTTLEILDAFKTWSQYGTVILHTHGAYWSFHTPSWLTELKNVVASLTDPTVKAAWQTIVNNIENSMMSWNGKMVLLTTGTYVGTSFVDIVDHTYVSDIVTGRIVVATDGEMLVTPWFIDKYNDNFPNSLIWLGACHSLQNDTLGSVLRKDGAGALFGFDESVYRSWNVSRAGVVLSTMLKDKKTAQEGFDKAIENGNNDGDGTKLVLSGNGKLKYDNSLQNPDFEDPDGAGSLQSWTKSGDARAIKAMQDDVPTSGKTMAIISSGLGRTTSYGSFSQSFTVPAGATNMTFSWNFYSAEFNDYCNKGYDDTFRVLINEAEVFRTSVDSLCGTGLIEVEDIDEKGDCFKSGWRGATVDMSGYADKDVDMRFEVQDKGDTIYDTAVLVDNIVINTATQ